MAGNPWTDQENDLIVADYFAMLADDLAGRSYSKAEHNRSLQTNVDRGRGAIEYKHQNISAVLKGLGEAWIEGYKPAFNFQDSLIDAVARWLALNQLPLPDRTPKGLADASELYFDPPPTLRNAPPPDETEQMMAVARRFDAAGRAERNRELGRAGEELVLKHEKASLRAHGLHDLAEAIRWTSDEDGDGAGYDIASFTTEGRPRLIEVKTTNGWERSPFHISRNELAVAKERSDVWRLVCVWNFARAPKAFELQPPLEAHVALTPTSFQADFVDRG